MHNLHLDCLMCTTILQEVSPMHGLYTYYEDNCEMACCCVYILIVNHYKSMCHCPSIRFFRSIAYWS